MMNGRSALLAILAALTVGALAGPAAAQLPKPLKESEMRAAGGRQVTGPELKQLWVGNTVYIILLKKMGPGAPGAVIANYYPNERIRRQKFPDSPKITESNWWMDGNNRCVEERVITAGHLCSSAWELAGTFYLCVLPEGDCGMSFRIAPGNPEKL